MTQSAWVCVPKFTHSIAFAAHPRCVRASTAHPSVGTHSQYAGCAGKGPVATTAAGRIVVRARADPTRTPRLGLQAQDRWARPAREWVNPNHSPPECSCSAEGAGDEGTYPWGIPESHGRARQQYSRGGHPHRGLHHHRGPRADRPCGRSHLRLRRAGGHPGPDRPAPAHVGNGAEQLGVGCDLALVPGAQAHLTAGIHPG